MKRRMVIGILTGLLMAAAVSVTACGNKSEQAPSETPVVETTVPESTTAKETISKEVTTAAAPEILEVPTMVTNKTEKEITAIYTAANGEQDWSDNIMTQESLKDDEQMETVLIMPNKSVVRDFKIETTDGETILISGVSFLGVNAAQFNIELTMDGEQGNVTIIE